jgi:hypothetical protein
LNFNWAYARPRVSLFQSRPQSTLNCFSLPLLLSQFCPASLLSFRHPSARGGRELPRRNRRGHSRVQLHRRCKAGSGRLVGSASYKPGRHRTRAQRVLTLPLLPAAAKRRSRTAAGAAQIFPSQLNHRLRWSASVARCASSGAHRARCKRWFPRETFVSVVSGGLRNRLFTLRRAHFRLLKQRDVSSRGRCELVKLGPNALSKTLTTRSQRRFDELFRSV